ncbi:hypothetical protein CENSYa_0705 [Cenarchaeum symbiosum A]|uniref:TrbL/VirB6 plasmid conjugal transfer protein n=1 Tax=Cenarchaeum symbiosum (strain A) TaxID=414004 RepID=A0RVH1_CENSY|nr:hypothetical protein CENSYa_0705 [Cenarchaeum symbiosum A]
MCPVKSPGVVSFVLEAIDGIMVILGVILFQAAFSGIAALLGGIFGGHYTDLLVSIPSFGYSLDGQEQGNHLFDIYAQMRLAAGVLILCIIVLAGAVRASQDSSLRRHSDDALRKAALAGLLILLFPIAWDPLALGMESGAAWVLNPYYTPGGPCPAEWDVNTIQDVHDASPYKRILQDAEAVCEPSFRVEYLVSRISGGTGYSLPADLDPFDWITTQIALVFTGVITDVFLSIAKSLVLINLFMLSLVIGIMADLLTGMILAALPLLVVLTMIPSVSKVPLKFLEALPALYIVPLLSGVVIHAGAAFVAESPGVPAPGLGWIPAAAVLFLAVSLPVMAVPLLQKATGAATQVVTAAVQAGAVVTAASALGAVRGGASGGWGGAARGLASGVVGGHAGSLGEGDDEDE